MKVKENNNFPETIFFILKDSGPKEFKSSELFAGKKVLLVTVPGAFTPTCSEEHVPGYVKHENDFVRKGVEKIFVLSANDPFVMNAWAKTYGDNNITFLADAEGDSISKLGYNLDLSVIGLGKRFSRFAMIIDDGIVKKIFDEDGGGLDASKAENVLNSI